MATFKFGRNIDIHWNGYDIQGPADSVFSIPDQLYEEFDADIAPVEPTLQWIDTNEFQTLQNSVPNYTIAATSPIAIASSTDTAGAVTKTWSLNANYSTSTHDHSGTYQPAGTYVNSVIGTSPASVSTTSGTATVSISSGTNPSGYLMAADGSGGVIFTPASTSGLTSVVGVSPISTAVSGGTVSVSLNANYQTAGTYVSSVVGTSPISASGTTAITISVDQSAITANSATNSEVLRTYVKNSSGSTITKGQVVYVTGADGTNALIGLSTASTEAGSSKTLGIAANTMTNNAFGYVVENGTLAGIDTSSTTAGASVWLGNTPGSLVFGAPPAEPSHSVYLGVVTKANPSTGEILVKVQNGYELDELHDVSAASPTNLDILQYKSSSAMWTSGSIANAGIAASSHTHNYQASGTYVNAVIGTSPASVSTSSGTATVSISSGTATSGQVLTANGSGGVSFTTPASIGSYFISSSSGSFFGSAISAPAGAYAITNYSDAPATVVTTGGTASLPAYDAQYLSSLSSLTSFSNTIGTSYGTTWTSVSSGYSTTITINAITYGNSLYVGGGSSSSIITSIDASNWTSRASAITSVSALVYGSSLYVAAGGSGGLSTSSDASTWTSRTSGVTVQINGLAYGNGVYVYVANNNNLRSSTNATTWTSRTSGFSAGEDILCAAYGGGTFAIAGTNGVLATSTDGTTWTTRTSGYGASKINAIIHDGTQFILAGNSGGLRTSPDGVTWTARTSGFSATNINTLAYGNGLYIAGGDSGKLTVSTDAITWTSVTSGFGASNIQASSFGSGAHLIGGAAAKLSISSTNPNAVMALLTPVTLQSL